MREGDAALAALRGMNGENGFVRVDDIVRIVVETMDAVSREEIAELDAIQKARRAEDAFPSVKLL